MVIPQLGQEQGLHLLLRLSLRFSLKDLRHEIPVRGLAHQGLQGGFPNRFPDGIALAGNVVVKAQRMHFLLILREQRRIFLRGEAALEIKITLVQRFFHVLRVLVAIPQVVDDPLSPVLGQHHRQVIEGISSIPGAVGQRHIPTLGL